MNKDFFLKKTLVLAFTVLALHAHAEFYEVEMTVFSNGSPRDVSEQSWPQNINVAYPASLASLSQKPIDEIYPEMTNPNRPSANPYLVPLLDERFSRHGEHVRKLQQSGEHRVLFSKTWLQKVEKEEFAKNIIIQGGKLEANVYEVGGTVSLYLTQAADKPAPALHVKTHLWHVTFGNNTSGQPWPIPASFTISNEGITPMATDNSVAIQRIGVLSVSEIINPSTLHYIDHPLFGVLIEARPYSAIQLSE